MRRDRLKQARKNKGYTQEDLASRVKTTKGTISNYENGHSTPPNEMLIDLANVLGVTTDWLLGRQEQSEKEKSKEADAGRAFFGGADKYTEEELAIAEAAAKAAIEAYRKGLNKKR